MQNVQYMIQSDGKKQMITGGALMAVSALFLAGLLFNFTLGTFFNVIFVVPFTISGLVLIVTGYSDWLKSQKALTLSRDMSTETVAALPPRMYLGVKWKDRQQVNLYDLSGKAHYYGTEQFNVNYKGLAFLSQFTSDGVIRPAQYTVHGEDGQPLYEVEKKGGFTTKSYVKNGDGKYVAYTVRTKNKTTGQQIFHYVERSEERWTAEGDYYIGHYTVKDASGKVWAVIKRGAIMKDAPEEFQKMSTGYAVEWVEKEDVPVSLITFLFIVQSHDNT
ncbi:hypothetical protein LCM20_13605 [Halobacillus litoralis]|uniref:hypothetical protein n=1 Tax=Halobacillus litoralis TaxID=45668 RepID=UPI001CD5DE94|nr:hypothetical protein [Halobacillus litoralis]MCA0971638.1 hypothetical protein [Halobacillus litoralis]